MKISKLTPEQESTFPQYVRDWTAIGRCTEPADRHKAEQAIRLMYMAGGLEPPPRIVWCSSPIAQALTRSIVQQLGKPGASVWASVWASVGDSVWDSVYGQHDAGWLSFYRFFRDIGLEHETSKLQGLWMLCESAGWALPHERICWISERTSGLRFDDAGRLHCEDGPAISYPDGWSIHCWHGTCVPAQWVEGKAPTAAEALQWQNMEQRRAACEIVGWHNILRKLNAVTIDRHANPMVGELVEVNIPDVGREKFLRVTCGTSREFALPVPPEMLTAEQSQRWLNFIPEDVNFLPEIRT